jgi:hypothetical protein
MEFHLESLQVASARARFRLCFTNLSEKEFQFLRMVEAIPELHCMLRLREPDAEIKDSEELYFSSREELEKFALFLATAKEVAENFPTHSLQRIIDKHDDSGGPALGV